MAGSQAVTQIRPLSALAELADCVKLQQTVWGFSDIELLPLPPFVVASQTGGQVLGAYCGAQMTGFCLAFPAIKPDGKPYLHSHMLAVLEEYRNQGVGMQLKMRQREDAIARRLDLIEWTFDPLELKNAFFNIERLGAIVRRYAENEYGTSSSPLQGGLPTDRCIAEWWIASSSVDALAHGREVGRASIQERIAVPADLHRIRREDPRRAREIQRANAARFQSSFQAGLAVIGFEYTEKNGVYLLGTLP